MKKVECRCGWEGGTADDFEGLIICPKCFNEINIEKNETEEKKKSNVKKSTKGGED